MEGLWNPPEGSKRVHFTGITGLQSRECQGRIRLLTVDDLEVWVSGRGRPWMEWIIELTATNGVVKTVEPPADPDLESDEAAELAYGRIIDAVEHWRDWSGYAG